MRPHRLSLCAFGPFPGAVDVDLDALAAGGVFLLHGETGAGKTTLLDAIGFALYGQVPGERGKARRLRSDHAAADVRTRVQLEATVGGRRLRITRSPEHQRQKLRGAGTTTEPAKVLLEEHSGTRWETVSTRAGEADQEIARLLGMSAEQFFQVVLLPQGEFARFLRSDSADRGRLLEQLFGTDRFRRVEDWLAQRRRTTAAAEGAARVELATLVARAAQAGDAEPPAHGAPADWAKQMTSEAAEVAAEARAVLLRRQAALDHAQAAVEAARTLDQRQQRRRVALRRQEELRVTADDVVALRRQLVDANRAAEVAPVLEAAARHAAVLDRAREEEASARAAVVPAGAEAPADVPVLRATAESARVRIGRLAGLRDLADSVRTDELAAEAAERAAADLGRRRIAVERAMDFVPARRAAHEQELDAARAAQARLPLTVAAAAQLRAAASDAAELIEARRAQAGLDVLLLAATKEEVARRSEALGIREARFDGMIAELAAGLEEGTPCPVCGSSHHPDPSEVRGDRLTRQHEDDANRLAESARQRTSELEVRLAACRATAEGLVGRLLTAGHGGDDATELAARLTAAAGERAGEVAALEHLVGRLSAAEAELAALEKEQAVLETERVALHEQQRAARDRAGSAGARAAAARSRLAGELGGADDLDSAMRRGSQRADALEALVTVVQATLRAAGDAAEAGVAAETASLAAGFPDPGAARTALRDPTWRQAAQQEVDARREEMAAVAAQLAAPDLAVPLDPPVDVTAAEQALAAARAAHTEALRAHSLAGRRADELAALAPQLTTVVRHLQPLVERAREAKELADLAAGQGANTLKMTLTSFVLAARLEEVAAAASERLLRMTQGRYSLAHTDAGRGGGRAGLGLLARDAWTGQDRETSTLSGGETFLASLALALGLADVVTAEAGGALIEALFVDEGFGTLDEDTLDEVMDVLDALREGGRIVGLVSHVAELRQRIPTQVQVRKSRTGSDLTLIGC